MDTDSERLLLLLSRFSRVRLCATPQTAAHQAPPSLGFSRQEHWSGLVAISFSQCIKVKVKSLSRVRLFATPWTVAYQAPPSMGFSRQEYWSGVPLPSPSERLVPSKGHVEGHPGHRGLSHKMRSLDSGNWKCPLPIYGHKLHHSLFSNQKVQLFFPTSYMLRTQVGVNTGAQ